LNTGLSDCR